MRALWRSSDCGALGVNDVRGDLLRDNLGSMAVGSMAMCRIQANPFRPGTQNLKRELEGGTNNSDTPIFSSGQNIPGESQESRSIGNRTTTETGSSGDPGGIVTMPFLHLGVRFEDSDALDRKAIEKVLNKARDWIRYAPNCWLIYTGKDAKTWSQRLREIPGMEDSASFLICEVLVNQKDKRDGWLSDSVWQWIKRSRPD